RNSPVLIDLQKVNGLGLGVAVPDIVELVRKLGFMPVGIRGGTEKQNHDAFVLELPVHSMHSSTAPVEIKTGSKSIEVAETEEIQAVEPTIENKLVVQPIRSGQRVYAKGDLIVTATVSAGAEIMAEGNIHVYGTLRGRALAGVLGNTDSRIFCSDLQAELISIAGIYQLSDDLSPKTAHKPVQISLDKQTLIIKDI
ncbi:MAG: septum site-determining protein MinC, partial [Methylomonas sp.]|nr:septum site-determining protein MinC [Methylomonas sp.]